MFFFFTFVVFFSLFFFFFFFFQAEDGIRDGTVTGVQTCALPIWPRGPRRRGRPSFGSTAPRLPPPPGSRARRLPRPRGSAWRDRPRAEIGRASCRERV